MKRVKRIFRLFLLCLPLFVGSCTIYYVDQPQPVGSKNIYKLPNKLTGSWHVKGEEDKAEVDWDSLSITKTYYHYVSREMYKDALSEVVVDTTVFIVDDKVYVKEDGELVAEYAFTTDGDSLSILLEDHDVVDFGPRAFLREIDYGFILNTQHEHLSNWWELKFVDTRDPDRLVVWSIGDGDIKLLPPYEVLHSELSEYMHAAWTSADVQDFIDKGGFSNLLVTLVYNEQL